MLKDPFLQKNWRENTSSDPRAGRWASPTRWTPRGPPTDPGQGVKNSFPWLSPEEKVSMVHIELLLGNQSENQTSHLEMER